MSTILIEEDLSAGTLNHVEYTDGSLTLSESGMGSVNIPYELGVDILGFGDEIEIIVNSGTRVSPIYDISTS